MSIIKSQILGILLAIFTAIGCIFYEKLVQNFSFMTVMIVRSVEFLIIVIIAYFFVKNKNDMSQDYIKFMSDSMYLKWSIYYILTGITTILWYIITRNQGVMAGSIYEVKYIVILALVYIFFGENKFTLNTGIGVVLALFSIYFISKK